MSADKTRTPSEKGQKAKIIARLRNEGAGGTGWTSDLEATLANHVDVNVPGKIVLIGRNAGSVAHNLLARHIDMSRLIFVSSDSTAIVALKKAFAASTFINAEVFESAWGLTEHVSERVAAIITASKQSEENQSKLMDAAPDILSVGGQLILMEGSALEVGPRMPRSYLRREAMGLVSEPVGGSISLVHRVVAYRLLKQRSDKVEKKQEEELSSLNQPLQDEGSIDSEGTTKSFNRAGTSSPDFSGLPLMPKRLWSADFRGKSKLEKRKALISFIKNEYGPFLPKHRDVMRDYLRLKDPKLHLAIKNFGFANLPSSLQMPSRDDKAKTRLQRAAAGAYDSMSKANKRSVRGQVDRLVGPASKKRTFKPTN
jgi:phospholipid N-methyltransferase